jgi:simple sugar transport system substrate-binding protein
VNSAAGPPSASTSSRRALRRLPGIIVPDPFGTRKEGLMTLSRFSRFLTLLGAAGAVALLSVSLPGCGKGGDASKGGDLTVGFIYVGPKDDYGYNQAHAEGAAAVKKIAGVKAVEQEQVPETDKVQKTIEDMIETDGAKAVFPTSFGYFDPHAIKMAKKYPKIEFFHCGGPWNKEKGHPENLHSFFGFIDECQYLSGIVAGHATKSKKLGFVAAKPIPQVLRNINAFTLGARTVDPKIETLVIFTGDWSQPTKEAEAAKALLSQGADVFTCHVDSPKVVVENVAREGKFVCGYHASQEPLAKDLYLTGAEWNWAKVYTDFINDVKAGKKIPNIVRGGLKQGMVKTSPYGPKVSDEAKKKADEAKAKLVAGKFSIFKGPLKNNKGEEIIPQGKEYAQDDLELEKMNYFVEGVKVKE